MTDTAAAQPKPQGSHEIIAANVRALMDQISEGRSEALTNYLAAMGRFHAYSFGNVMEIARQKPTATRVAGFHTWKKLGRSVSKGEKGIRILAPMVKGNGKKEDTLVASAEERKGPFIVGFRNVYVFDVSQTSGADLPQLSSEATGDAGPMNEKLLAFIESRGIQVEFTDSIAPALGMSFGGSIAIMPDQSPAETFTTLVHELAHEILHKCAETRKATTKTVRETEAEAVAFAVGKAIGLEMGCASCDYILLYKGDVSGLTESLCAIQRTATEILSALREPAMVEEGGTSRDAGREVIEETNFPLAS